jgi:DNA-binding response OmpR family regulator
MKEVLILAKLLIVEDDKKTNEAVCEYLRSTEHEAIPAYDGQQSLTVLGHEQFDLVVLDIMLPKITGISVLHEIRQNNNIPVLMLTAVEDEYTQIISFDEQADDYMTKPFSMVLLGKRITALLRRSGKSLSPSVISFGDVTVDFAGYTANDENGKIDITPKEIELLRLLVDHSGLVLTRTQILNDLWGYNYPIIDRTIDTYIKNIRKKLRLDCIVTVKGIGYKYEVKK